MNRTPVRWNITEESIQNEYKWVENSIRYLKKYGWPITIEISQYGTIQERILDKLECVSPSDKGPLSCAITRKGHKYISLGEHRGSMLYIESESEYIILDAQPPWIVNSSIDKFYNCIEISEKFTSDIKDMNFNDPKYELLLMNYFKQLKSVDPIALFNHDNGDTYLSFWFAIVLEYTEFNGCSSRTYNTIHSLFERTICFRLPGHEVDFNTYIQPPPRLAGSGINYLKIKYKIRCILKMVTDISNKRTQGGKTQG